jgi:hypothetical protein
LGDDPYDGPYVVGRDGGDDPADDAGVQVGTDPELSPVIAGGQGLDPLTVLSRTA